MRRLVVYTVLFSAVLAAAVPTSTASTAEDLEARERGSYALSRGCSVEYRSQVARNRIRRALLDPENASPDRRQVRRLAVCVATREKARAGRRVERAAWAWRVRPPQVFRILYLRKYVYLDGTLAAIRWCESTNDPRAVSGSGAYRGWYQFSFSTWATVGGSGDPAAAHPWEQTYRAAILYSTGGPGHWPNCP